MTITIVIPTLNEAAVLPTTLTELTRLGFDHLLFVDGGSLDHTRDIIQGLIPTTPPAPNYEPTNQNLSDPRVAEHPSSANTGQGGRSSQPLALASHPSQPGPTPLMLVTSTPGRARQMNQGAGSTQDDVLLFLHADTQLPRNARASIEAALADPVCVGGRFDLRFEPDRGWSWLIGRMINLRSRWSGIATGDQAIFVRRFVFEQLGGYADLPVMEDVDFTQRLRRMGRVEALHEQVVTSFRRWEACGPIRTIVLMWLLRFLFWIGVSPHRLSRFYTAVR